MAYLANWLIIAYPLGLKKMFVPLFHKDTWVCMPEPLSPKRGFGMNVATMLCFLGHVLDDVLEQHALVRHLDEGRIPHVHLALARRGDLVVLYLHLHARP